MPHVQFYLAAEQKRQEHMGLFQGSLLQVGILKGGRDMAITKIEVSKSIDADGIAIVLIKGAIITNLSGTDAAPVMDEILATCNPPRVVLNLTNVRYLDSYSFNWIIKLMKEAERRAGTFVISDPNPDILALFDLSSFGKVVPVYRTERDARAALTSGDDSARIANT